MKKVTNAKARPVNARDRHRAAVNAAMPDVKAAVAKHGRTVVSACLQRLKLHDKQARLLAELKSEVAALEKQL